MKRLILMAFMLISGFAFAQTEGYKVGDVLKDF